MATIGFFLPEVREFITRHTAYNKHDTGWAKGAPSEDRPHYPTVRVRVRVRVRVAKARRHGC